MCDASDWDRLRQEPSCSESELKTMLQSLGMQIL